MFESGMLELRSFGFDLWVSGSHLIAHPVYTGLFRVSHHHYDASRRFSSVGYGERLSGSNRTSEVGSYLAIPNQGCL